MSLEARHAQTQQAWPPPLAHIAHSAIGQASRFARFGPVAVQDLQAREACEVGSDVTARRLKARGYRYPVSVVLNVEKHWKLLGRGDRQCRPESVGCYRCFSAQH